MWWPWAAPSYAILPRASPASVQSVGGYVPGFDWLHAWIEHCLFYGRPLALAPGLGWAWGVALTFLALYLCIALILHEGVDRCVRTLETRPGATVLAALITVLFTPVLFVLLCITVVGIAAVPFVAVALFCASLFGKAVMLAWIGRRFLGARRDGPPAHTAARGAHRRDRRVGALPRAHTGLRGVSAAGTVRAGSGGLYAHRRRPRAPGGKNRRRPGTRSRLWRPRPRPRRQAAQRPRIPPRRPYRRRKRYGLRTRPSHRHCRAPDFGSAWWRCFSMRCLSAF